MKRKYYYLLSFLAPMALLFIASAFCGYIPFGSYTFNNYDSYYEYPTFLIELGNILQNGRSIFYTLHAGMGVNFFSILNLYGGSPLNLFSVFFDNTTIYIFYTLLIYVKLGLSGLTMSIYLNSLNTKYKNTIWNVIFSLIYATSGWAIAMSMHIMWLDAYILLPLIIKGLDKLILEGKFLSYTLFLALAIIINYYTGFMLCIFMVIYFVYKSVITNNFNKKTILRFLISSIIAALLSCVILIPTLFNLLGGRFSNLEYSFNYLSFDYHNLLSTVYNMTIGSFISIDHYDYGTTTLYITIFSLVLLISYFFNKKIAKKNKIVTLLTLIFFQLCFTIPLLDYTWNLFQKPIWWEHRYQFVYIFLTIIIAYESFCKSETIKMSSKSKSIITIIFMFLLIFSFSYKVNGLNLSNFRVMLLLLSILLFYIYMKSSKTNKWLIILIILELILNTTMTLLVNRGQKYEAMIEYNEEVNSALEKKEDKNDYRIVTTSYPNTGLVFDFNAVELFSSSNNRATIEFFTKLNLIRDSQNIIMLYSNNPTVFSLLGIKYLHTTSKYFPCENGLCTNEYALPFMYSVSDEIKDLELSSDFQENINNIYSVLLEEKTDLFYDIPIDIYLENVEVDENGNFYNAKEDVVVSISATAAKECVIVFNDNQFILQEEAKIYINDQEYQFPQRSDYLLVLDEGDTLTATYRYKSLASNAEPLKGYLFSAIDKEKYEKSIEQIQEKTNYTNIEDPDYILKGEIEVNNDILLITIPYDEGLTIKVDGKETEYFKVLDALIGLDVENGIHTIEITYFPKGLKAGSIISIASLIILLTYTKITNRKKR